MNASTAASVNFAPKHLSGIDVIDNAWGGLYRGGSYLVYGRAASGRGLLTLMFARTGAALGEPTLFVSPDRQKDLMIQAASIGFNLRESYESGVVRLVRVPPLMNLQNMGDDGVAKALWDLVTLIRQHRPTRLIMNDFMPFVAFRSYDRFRNEFIQFLEQIDSLDTTTVLVMPEPANQQSARVIEFMASQMTGSIRIELGEDSPSTTKRRISLIPHIGHIKRQVVDYWDLEDLVVQSGQASPVPPPAKAVEPDKTSDFIFTPTSVQAPIAGQSGMESYAVPFSEQAPSEPMRRAAEPSTPSVEEAFGPTSAQPPVYQPSPQQPSPEQPEAPLQQAPEQAPPQPAPIFNVQAPPVPLPPQVPPMPQAPRKQETPLRADQEHGLAMPSMTSGSDESNRIAFQQRLDRRFAEREEVHKPFLLFALRMDRASQQARPFDFDFLMDLVSEELGGQVDMLAIPDLERMVVFLGNSRPEEAQSFFARLKDRLRIESPLQADHLLHSVSAIVVPEGRPFKTATEFLNYAFDEA